MNKLLISTLVFCFALSANAENAVQPEKKAKEKSAQAAAKLAKDKSDEKEKPEKSPWAGSNIQFGYVLNTGNTYSQNLNGALVVDYTQGKWQSDSKLSGQLNTGRSGTNKQVFSAESQGQYNFRPRNFFYVRANATFDKFSPYDYVIIESAGFGYEIIKTKKIQLTVQMGPGGRHSRERESNIIRNDVILDTNSKFVWNITNKAVFKEELNADFGQPYNYYQSSTSLTTQLIGHLGVQVAFSVQHYSALPPLSTNEFKTDTTTTVGLVYTF